MSKKINLIFLSFIFLYSLYCTFQLGYTWDVLFYYDVGKERLDYLLSLGANEVDEKIFARKFLTGAYSTISAFFVQFFPRKYLLESLYLINLCVSIIGIFGLYHITKEFFNKQIGQITFVICFFNPIFFGHMAMNGIDTIIAFANIWCFLILIKYLKYQHISSKRKKYTIYFGLLFGLGLGVRYSFFITLVPVFIFTLIEISYLKNFTNKNFSNKKFFIDILKVLTISYFFMVLFWPHTHENIFFTPFKLATQAFAFGFGVPFILFNGEIFQPHELPKNYILINLFYKMPEFIIISFVIFILFFKRITFYLKNNFKSFYLKFFLIIGIILFPNLLFIVSPYAVYDGMRLFLFLIPYICIVPALLIFFLYKSIKNKLYKFLFFFLISLKIFFLFNFYSLTPYHYVYINIFAGKYSDNYKKFENDYWGVSTKKLILSLNKNRKIFDDSKIKFAVCGLPENIQNIYLKKIKNLKFKIVSRDEDFDFIIMNNRVIWDKKDGKYDSKEAETCFQKYQGEDVIKVKKRGLIISKITKI